MLNVMCEDSLISLMNYLKLLVIYLKLIYLNWLDCEFVILVVV